MPKKSEPIYGLDWLRFAAAMLVTGWHLGYRLFDPSAPHINRFASGLPIGAPLIPDLTIFGWIGVQIFFVISGVVISYSAARATPAQFVISRLTRLYPVMIYGLLLAVAINIGVWGMSAQPVMIRFVKALLFMPNSRITPQFWTIPVEMVFYAVIWLMLVARRIEWIERLALVLIVCSGIFLIASATLHVPGVVSRVARPLLLQHGIYFGIGILAHAMATHGVTAMRVALMAVATALAPLQIVMAMHKYGVDSVATGPAWIIPYVIWLVSLGVVLASLFWSAAIGRAVRGAGLAGISRALGLATYPLYMVHIHVGGLVATIAVGAGLSAWLAIWAGIAGSLIVSLVMALVLEPPAARAIRRGLTAACSRVISPATA